LWKAVSTSNINKHQQQQAGQKGSLQMNKIFASLMLAVSFAGTAHAALQPVPPQTTPVVCVTDGCTSESQGQSTRR
jgi:hypothetical protein